MDWSQCTAVDRHPGKLGGKWCFAGTRMPVDSLFEHLDSGCSIDEFLEWFPDIDPEQVHAILAFARESLKQPEAAA